MPPVAFNPIPPSTPVDPMARNPVRIMVRILNVVARNPNIAPSVPPPVPRIPNVIVTRRGWHGLNPDCGRGNPDNNFLCRRPGRQAQHVADHYHPGKSTDRARDPLITHIRINRKRDIKLREWETVNIPRLILESPAAEAGAGRVLIECKPVLFLFPQLRFVCTIMNDWLKPSTKASRP